MAAGPHRCDDPCEGGAGVGRVVEHARAIDQVERALGERKPAQVGLDEADPVDPVAARGRGGEGERRSREIEPDHDPVGASEVETGLAGAAADFRDPGVAGDRGVEQTREGASSGAGAKPGQAVIGRIIGKGRGVVELADDFGPGADIEAQACYSVGCRP